MPPDGPKIVPRALLAALGSLWDRSWAALGRSWLPPGASWGDLGASWGDLEPSWGDLGAILGAQERLRPKGVGGRRPQRGTP